MNALYVKIALYSPHTRDKISRISRLYEKRNCEKYIEYSGKKSFFVSKYKNILNIVGKKVSLFQKNFFAKVFHSLRNFRLIISFARAKF